MLAKLLRSKASSVVRPALAAVANLALRNAACQNALLTAGVGASLATCLRYNNVGVQERAAVAVANVAWANTGAQLALAEAGVLTPLVKMLGAGSMQVRAGCLQCSHTTFAD